MKLLDGYTDAELYIYNNIISAKFIDEIFVGARLGILCPFEGNNYRHVMFVCDDGRRIGFKYNNSDNYNLYNDNEFHYNWDEHTENFALNSNTYSELHIEIQNLTKIPDYDHILNNTNTINNINNTINQNKLSLYKHDIEIYDNYKTIINYIQTIGSLAYIQSLKYTRNDSKSWKYYVYSINKDHTYHITAKQIKVSANNIILMLLDTIPENEEMISINKSDVLYYTSNEITGFTNIDVDYIFTANRNTYLFIFAQDLNSHNNTILYEININYSQSKIDKYNDELNEKLDIDRFNTLIIENKIIKLDTDGFIQGWCSKTGSNYINNDAANVTYGYHYIRVEANKTYRVIVSDQTALYKNSACLMFIEGNSIINNSTAISNKNILKTCESDSDEYFITNYGYTFDYTPNEDGYLYQYNQNTNIHPEYIEFYLLDGETIENIPDYINSKLQNTSFDMNTATINPPQKINIICSGSSITWGDGYLQASMVKYLDQILKQELSNTITYDKMKYENGNIINNNLFYNGSAVMFSNINDSIEFDLYGNEIAICQVKRRSNDYGIISVYADGIKIGQFDNYNAPKHEIETFTGSNIKEVILKHPYTFNHQIYINGSNESINNIQINTQGYGASIQSGVDAFIYRHPINGGEDNVHALQLNLSLGTVTSLRVEYDYGHLICYERSNLGQTTDNEFINESTYGAGTVSYDPDRPTSGISSGMEFRASNPNSFFIHKFTEYKNRHFKIVLEGGSANPYMMINFATNRYHNIMNAGIGGWDLKDLISSSNKLNKWTQFFKWFKPDFIFQESMTNDDWQFNTRRIKRDIGEITLEQLRVMPQLEVNSITYNEFTEKYRVYMCTGIISSITTTSLISTDIINTQTQVGDIVRIGNYYGDMHQIICRKITEINLTTGEIKWLEPIITDNILNIDTIEDLIGKEINIRNLDTYKSYYETLINNVHSVSPNTNIVIVHNGLPNLYTRQLWGYDIVHRELAQHHNHVTYIDAQEDMYDTMFSTITGAKNEIITSTGASEYNLSFAGTYRSWQGFKVLVNGIDVYGKDCYVQGMMAYFIKDEYSGAQLNKTNCYDRSKCDWVNRGNMKLVFYKNIPSTSDTIQVQYADTIWSSDYCHPSDLGAYSYAQSYAKALKINL